MRCEVVSGSMREYEGSMRIGCVRECERRMRSKGEEYRYVYEVDR